MGLNDLHDLLFYALLGGLALIIIGEGLQALTHPRHQSSTKSWWDNRPFRGRRKK